MERVWTSSGCLAEDISLPASSVKSAESVGYTETSPLSSSSTTYPFLPLASAGAGSVVMSACSSSAGADSAVVSVCLSSAESGSVVVSVCASSTDSGLAAAVSPLASVLVERLGADLEVALDVDLVSVAIIKTP